MSAIQEFIRKNIDSGTIVIPWSMSSLITIADVAFIATQKTGCTFILHKDYKIYIGPAGHDGEDDNVYCDWEDKFEVRSEFDNYENICLLFVLLYRGHHNGAYIYGLPKGTIGERYLRQAWDFAVEHDLTHTQFGTLIRKFGYIPEVNIDPFLNNYLGRIEMKSSRNV